ncbi:MAG: B12-binding domain-containing radical SAM protein [Clostridiales bacterium]|nr:B12-binding domain-containing radical SAM protein [Clostridiales bacterium]
MKILLVYPENPITYWGFQYALKFTYRKAAYPPLGLLTVAAILPQDIEKKLIDMNVSKLKDNDILWADYVLISAMVVQRASAKQVIERCKKYGVKTIAGGPLFTTEYESFGEVDHLLLGEGEITIPEFISDLKHNRAKPIYKTDRFADLNTSPVPSWHLIHVNKYVSQSIQYSRGCPYHCDFCNITALFGNIPRTKDSSRLLSELDALYETGWRGNIFFVDDNFIGNKKKLINDTLPKIIDWMKKHRYPFTFSTEASINLADDKTLMELMSRAGFKSVFVGIETPDEDSLAECKKTQNKDRDLMDSVRKIQCFGMEVQGGFIVGFDNDKPSIFRNMVDFIQDSGIISAMVGLLNAPKGTKLYQRMKSEGRLKDYFSGNNTDYTINFTPKMDLNLLVKGYKSIVSTIYSPKYYYERVRNFLKGCAVKKMRFTRFNPIVILIFLRSVVMLGIFGKERVYFWKLLLWSLFKHPKLLPAAVKFSIFGYHFRKIYEETGV